MILNLSQLMFLSFEVALKGRNAAFGTESLPSYIMHHILPKLIFGYYISALHTSCHYFIAVHTPHYTRYSLPAQNLIKGSELQQSASLLYLSWTCSYMSS